MTTLLLKPLIDQLRSVFLPERANRLISTLQLVELGPFPILPPAGHPHCPQSVNVNRLYAQVMRKGLVPDLCRSASGLQRGVRRLARAAIRAESGDLPSACGVRVSRRPFRGVAPRAGRHRGAWHGARLLRHSPQRWSATMSAPDRNSLSTAWNPGKFCPG